MYCLVGTSQEMRYPANGGKSLLFFGACPPLPLGWLLPLLLAEGEVVLLFPAAEDDVANFRLGPIVKPTTQRMCLYHSRQQSLPPAQVDLMDSQKVRTNLEQGVRVGGSHK